MHWISCFCTWQLVLVCRTLPFFFSALSILVGSPLSCSVINTMSSVARISLSRRHFLWPYTIYQSVDQTHQQSQCTFSAVSSLTNQMFVWLLEYGSNEWLVYSKSTAFLQQIRVKMEKYFQKLFLRNNFNKVNEW